MAVIKAVNSRASIGKAVNYVTNEKKTGHNLITGKDCNPFNAIDDMKATKELWGKTGGREYKHYVQSFHKDEKISPVKAHEIACKLAEEMFKGYECVIGTHIDRGHIHSHIIVNSVSFENGKKFRQSKEWLQQMKDQSDKLCVENNLTICEKGKTFEGQELKEITAYNKDKYNLLEKAKTGEVKSYVHDTAQAVLECKENAVSRDDFITRMKEKGYQTDWKDTRKYITFTDKDGHKVRNSNIEKTFRVELGKEQLEKAFEENRNKKPVMKRSEAYQWQMNIDYLQKKYDRIVEIGKEIKANKAECKKVEDWYENTFFHLHGREDRKKLDAAIQKRDLKNLDLKAEREEIYADLEEKYEMDIPDKKALKNIIKTMQDHLKEHDIIPDTDKETVLVHNEVTKEPVRTENGVIKKEPELDERPAQYAERSLDEELADQISELQAFRGRSKDGRKTLEQRQKEAKNEKGLPKKAVKPVKVKKKDDPIR